MIDKSDIHYILSDFNLENKDYTKYINNVIESTSILLKKLEMLKDNRSSSFRVDRQIERGVSYMEKTLMFLETNIATDKKKSEYFKQRNKSFDKTISFFNFLINYDLITGSHIVDEYKSMIFYLKVYQTLNEKNSYFDLKLIEQISEHKLSMDCILDWGKNLETDNIEGYNGLINLFNTPNKHDILKASVYHIARIIYEHELDQVSDILIDYSKQENQKYLQIASNIVVNLFKNYDGRMDYQSGSFDAFKSTSKWTGFMYDDYLVGIICQMPKHMTGYASISSYYEYMPTNPTGFKLFIFPEKLTYSF